MHRKDLKGQLIQLRHTLYEKQLTNENRVEITKKIQILKQEIKDHDDHSKNDTLIKERRQIVSENEDLKDIFSLFWKSIRGFIDAKSKLLTEDGYTKLNVAMQYALTMHIDEKDAIKNAKDDWLYDCKIYNNKINEMAFTDILYDLIETSTDVMDHIYYSAFAWTLQNEILDLTKKPPKIKAKREIHCILKPNCEAEMIMNYLHRKIEIKHEIEERNKLLNMHIAEEEVDLEQELRLGARKEGLQNFNDNQMSMLEALGHAHEAKLKAKARRRKEGDDGSCTDDSSMYSDTDSEGNKGSRGSFSDGSDMERSNGNKQQGDDANKQSLHDQLAAAGRRKPAAKPHANRQSRSYFLFQSAGEGADTGYYVPESSFVKKYKPFVYEPHQGKKKKEREVQEGPSYLWATSTQRRKTKRYKQQQYRQFVSRNHENSDEEEKIVVAETKDSSFDKNSDEEEKSLGVETTRSSLLSPITEVSKPLTPVVMPIPKVPELKPSYKSYNVHTLEGYWGDKPHAKVPELKPTFKSYNARTLEGLLGDKLQDAKQVPELKPSFKSYNEHTLEGYWGDKLHAKKPVNKLEKLLRGSSHPKDTKKYRFRSRELAVLLDESSEWRQHLDVEAQRESLNDTISVSNYSNVLTQSSTSDDMSVLTTPSALGLSVANSYSSTRESVNSINNNVDIAGKVRGTLSSSLCLPKKTSPTPVYNVNYERSLRYSRYQVDGLIKANILKTQSAMTSGSNSSDEGNGSLVSESQGSKRESRHLLSGNAETPGSAGLSVPATAYDLFYHNIRTKYLLDDLTDNEIRALYSESVDASHADSTSALSPVVSRSTNSYVYVDGSGVEQVQTILAEVNSTVGGTASSVSKTNSWSIDEDMYLRSRTEPLFFQGKSSISSKSKSSLEPLLSPISLPRHSGKPRKVGAMGSVTVTQFPYNMKAIAAVNSKKKELTTAEKQAMVAIGGAMREYEKERNDVMQLCVNRAAIMEATQFIQQQQALKQNRAMAESNAQVEEEQVQPFDKDVVNSYMEMSLNKNTKLDNVHTVAINKGVKPSKKRAEYNPGNADESSAQVSMTTEPQSIDDEFNEVRSQRAYSKKASKRLEPLSAKEYDRVLAAADTSLYQQ